MRAGCLIGAVSSVARAGNWGLRWERWGQRIPGAGVAATGEDENHPILVVCGKLGVRAHSTIEGVVDALKSEQLRCKRCKHAKHETLKPQHLSVPTTSTGHSPYRPKTTSFDLRYLVSLPPTVGRQFMRAVSRSDIHHRPLAVLSS